MIDHNVMRFHIAVHDALAVTEVQRLEKLEDVVPDINILELGIKAPKVGIVDILEDQGRGLALQWTLVLARGSGWPLGRATHLGVAHNIQKSDHVGTAGQVLEDLDLALDFLLLDWLEHLDDALLVINHVDALEHLGVLAATCANSQSQPLGRARVMGGGMEWGSAYRSCGRPRSSRGRPS